jgi:hypothetical protein
MPDRREDYHYDGALSTKLGAHRLREASDMGACHIESDGKGVIGGVGVFRQ